MGRGRPGQNTSAVEALFPEYSGTDIRRGLQRSRASGRSRARIAQHVARGRPQGRRVVGVRQQAGPAKRNERVGSHKQTGTEPVAPEKMVHSIHLRHAG